MENPLETLANFKAVKIGNANCLIGESTPHDFPPQPFRPAWLDWWEPREVDLKFFRRMLARMKDKSIWLVPGNNSAYAVNKTAKTMALTKGKVDQWFWQNHKALAKLGYQVYVNLEIKDGGGKSHANSANN